MQSEQNPYIPPDANLKLESQRKDVPYFKTWLIFFLVATGGGFLAGAALGGVIGAIMASQSGSIENMKEVASVAGFMISIPISFFAFRWAVRKFIVNQK